LSFLSEEFLDGHVLLGLLLHDLGDGQLEVVLIDVDSTLAQSVHSGFGANALRLKTKIKSFFQYNESRKENSKIA